MPGTGDPTIDQLRVFLAAVRYGGFTGASRAVHRTQPTVSYAVAELERMLGLILFDRGGHRAHLTLAGQAMLEDANAIVGLADRMRARAQAMRSGMEADLGVCVDVMYPPAVLAAYLAAFAEAFPTVRLALSVKPLGGVADTVLRGEAALGLAGVDAGIPDALEHERVAWLTLVPVAAPSHPLAELGRIGLAEASKHVQLVLPDPSDVTAGRSFGVLSPRTWRIGDLAGKHALLIAGLGWGNMPEHMVADDIAAGRLVKLNLAAAPSHNYAIDLITRRDAAPGPAASWLAERFREGLGGEGRSAPDPAESTGSAGIGGSSTAPGEAAEIRAIGQ